MTILASAGAASAQTSPQDVLSSQDKRYSIEILHSALPGSDPNGAFFTITVRDGGRNMSQYSTEGYLLDAFWSPDGKYVAVNNRRANSGDYVWVFRLSDGRAIKRPVDAVQEQRPWEYFEDYIRRVVKHITAVYPELTLQQFTQLFSLAHSWTKSGNLEIRTESGFRNLGEESVVLWGEYKFGRDKLLLVSQRVEKTK